MFLKLPSRIEMLRPNVRRGLSRSALFHLSQRDLFSDVEEIFLAVFQRRDMLYR